jgi:hypothetical protein
MESFCHWLIELDEVYTRHAARHGPHRLLPAEALPAHGRVPKDAEPSPQSSGPDGRTVGHTTPRTCTCTRIDAMKEHAVPHEARHGSGDNGHG